jgi:hypothetical protein
MSYVLELFLAEVEKGLEQLPRGRRRLFLRELETHLLDEAEARGLVSDVGLRQLIAEKESPEALAAEIANSDEGSSTHRGGSALLGGSFIGLAASGMLWLMNAPWYICLGWYVALGLAVGASLFSFRPYWQQLHPALRLMSAVLFGTLLAVPLGFTGDRFWAWRMFYGAFLGYLVERHSQLRPLWQLVADTLAYSILIIVVDLYIFCPEKHFSWGVTAWLLCFNFGISFALLGAMAIKRVLSGRWLLASQSRI